MALVTILASLVLDSTGVWVRISARTPISRREISKEGFTQRLVSPPATSQYIESVGIISDAHLCVRMDVDIC
jgi:hypothetical protein